MEEPKPTKETMRGETPVSEGDLGQKEAELEKTGKEQWKGAKPAKPLSGDPLNVAQNSFEDAETFDERCFHNPGL